MANNEELRQVVGDGEKIEQLERRRAGLRDAIRRAVNDETLARERVDKFKQGLSSVERQIAALKKGGGSFQERVQEEQKKK